MDFVQALRSENSRAVFALTVSLFAIGAVNAAAIANLYVPPDWSWLFLSAGLLLQLVAFGFRIRSEIRSRHVQKLRHCSLIYNGLGSLPSRTQLANLSVQIDKVTYPVIPDYYSSPEPPSEKRLVANVAESAFFSLNIANRAGDYLVKGTILLGLIMFYVLLFLVFRTHDRSNIELAAQVCLLIFGFVGAGDFAILAFRFKQAASDGREVLAECQRLQSIDSLSLVDAMNATSQYELMMANCPPLPSWIYKRSQKHLNDAWLGRRSEQSGVDTSAHAG